ncbi:MAG: TRAP transporter substrate-binding protein [Desulfobacteraceae bacterium]|nr:TRAP transporter substrate-binding protein [Desulfobacteraceae bacterium]
MENFKKNAVILIIGLLSFLFTFNGSVFAKEIELKMASWASPKHFAGTAIKNWIKDVNEQGKGKVKISHYPGGQLYGPKDMHKAVAKGIVDMGQALQPRMMSMVPMFHGLYLPFLYDNIDQAAKAYEGESKEILDKAMAKKNLKMIFPIFNDGVQMFSNKKNIQSLEDLKGMRILTTSNIVSKILQKTGAAPDTSVPFTEQYMALKRGLADGNTTTIISGYFRKNYEVCQYITKMDMSFATSPIIINLKKWNSLPADIQAMMIEAGIKQARFSQESSKQWLGKFTQNISQIEGVSVTELSADQRNKIKELSQALWKEWADKNGEDAKRLVRINMN